MSTGVGKDSALYANGRNASPYVKDYDIGMMAEVADRTTMGSSFIKRLGGLKDSVLNLNGYYDGATNAIVDILNAALGQAADTIACAWILGEAAVGAFGFGMRIREKDYQIDMPVGGIITVTGSGEGDGDIEYIQSLHPLAAETAGANGTTLDGGAGSSNGGSSYLQVTAFTGTSITVKIQHSTDGASWSDLATHTAATAGGTSERISWSGTTNRYLRSVWSGTITSATFSHGAYRG